MRPKESPNSGNIPGFQWRSCPSKKTWLRLVLRLLHQNSELILTVWQNVTWELRALRVSFLSPIGALKLGPDLIWLCCRPAAKIHWSSTFSQQVQFLRSGPISIYFDSTLRLPLVELELVLNFELSLLVTLYNNIAPWLYDTHQCSPHLFHFFVQIVLYLRRRKCGRSELSWAISSCGCLAKEKKSQKSSKYLPPAASAFSYWTSSLHPATNQKRVVDHLKMNFQEKLKHKLLKLMGPPPT